MFDNCDVYDDEVDDADAYHDSGDSETVGEEDEMREVFGCWHIKWRSW